MRPRHYVIYVTGSMRLWREITDACRKLTKAGYVVLSPYKVSFRKSDDGRRILNNMAKASKKKIRIADTLLVISKDGYIGDGVREQIAYAEKLKKSVKYFDYKPKKGAVP